MHRKRLGLLLSVFWIPCILLAQELKLSPMAQVSVITVGPGSSLNDAFGHNAFRIKDPTLGLDVTYGYGEYDFDAPYFYLKFAQGKLNYMISRIDFNRLYRFYVYQNRTMQEQVLNLSATEKQKLLDFLENNYRPENRRYLYDFFYDNCATRIRDVLESTSDSKINFNTPKDFEPKTFRELIYGQVDKNTWGSLGIDVALGSVIDQNATPYEHMFLPRYIYEFFENATKNGTESLVKSSHTLYTPKEQKASNEFLTSPLFVFCVLGFLIIWLTFKDYKNQKRNKLLDGVLLGMTGIIGVLVLLLWLATDHTATAQNFNVLWAFPLNLWILFKVCKSKVKPWVVRYFKFLLIMLALMCFHWLVGIQQFAIGLIPLLLAMVVRYLYLIVYFQKPENQIEITKPD